MGKKIRQLTGAESFVCVHREMASVQGLVPITLKKRAVYVGVVPFLRKIALSVLSALFLTNRCEQNSNKTLCQNSPPPSYIIYSFPPFPSQCPFVLVIALLKRVHSVSRRVCS